MHRKPLGLAAASVLLVAFGAACSSAAPAAVAQSNQQPGVVEPAQSPAAPGNQQAASTLAPVCQTTKSCQVPTASQAKVGCVKKIPYTNVQIPPGTTFEVVDKSGNFTCSDSGQVVGGKQVIACHGTELQSFDLKLTNSSCEVSGLAAGSGQCQDGFGYDASQKCCSPLSGGSGSSTTVTVDLGACPLPQIGTP